MSIDDQESVAVRKVLERLGDEAVPAPAFEQLRLSPTSAPSTTKRVAVVVLMSLATVIGLGLVAQWVRLDPSIETATADPEPESAARPSVVPSSDAFEVPGGFRPPRFQVDDHVVYPVTLLDGSRVALWLSDRFLFDPDTYTQSAGLMASDGSLPWIRVDVENCVGCRQGHTMQVGPWQIVATGDGLTDEVWGEYSELIETFPTKDGYLRFGGDVTVTPGDSPDVVLQDGGLRVSVFARECASGPYVTQTARGFQASNLEAAAAIGLCAEDDQLEVWVPDSMSDSDLDAVLFDLVEFGPLTRGRRGFASTGPARNSEVIVTSGRFMEDRLIGYEGSNTRPIWHGATGAGSAFILGTTMDTVVVAGDKGPVQGIRILDGSKIWQVELEEGESPGIARMHAASDFFVLPSSFKMEGATEAPRVRAMDAGTGSVLWTTSLSMGTELVGARPTVTGSLVLVADTVSQPGSAVSSSVHALDRDSGEVVWQFDLETNEQGSHTQEIVTDTDSAYVTSGAGTVFAMDLDTGTEKWRVTGVGALNEQLQLRNDVVVSGSNCLDIETGARIGCVASPVTPEDETPPAAVPGVGGSTDDVALLSSMALDLPEWLEARGGHSVSWTGSELIVWGGWSNESATISYADGAAYDPQSNTWRRLAPAPLSGRAYHTAVWTGDQLLVVGGQTRPGEVVDDGASYDPIADSWSEIASVGESHEATSPPPVEGVWTGQQLVLWYRDQGIVRAFDPVQGSWSDLPDLDLPRAEVLGALRWTGSDLVALAGDGPGAMWAATLRPSIASEWSELPPVIFERPGASSDPFPSNSAVANGQLVVWSRSGRDAPTFVLDLDEKLWTEIPTVPINPCEGHVEPLSLGAKILVMDTCGNDDAGGAAIYDAETRSWEVRDTGPTGRANLGEAVWTGNEVLVAETTCCYGSGNQPFQWSGSRYRCVDAAVEEVLADFFDAVNARDSSLARDSLVGEQSNFLWFSDILHEPAQGESLEASLLANIEPQLQQLTGRGETFELGEIQVVGQDNAPGLVEFNYRLERLSGDGTLITGGKGALNCELNQFALLVIGG